MGKYLAQANGMYTKHCEVFVPQSKALKFPVQPGLISVK